MADRSTFVAQSNVGRSRGPIVQPHADNFNLIKQKAQQAAQFYHTIGLSNGDLPRDVASTRPENKRWSGCAEKKFESDGQSSTPSGPSPTKYGATWLKPAPPIHIPNSQERSKDGSTPRCKTLPRKEREQEQPITSSTPKTRCKSSSQASVSDSRQLQTVDIPDVETFEKFTISVPPTFSSSDKKRHSSDRFNTVPRNFEESKQKTARSIYFDNRTPQANGISPGPPSRSSSHLYDKQLSGTKSKPNKSEFTIAYTLPNTKPKQDDSLEHPTSKPRRSSPAVRSQLSEPISFGNFRDDSEESSPRKSPNAALHRQRCRSDTQNDVAKVQSNLSQSLDSTDGGGFMQKHFRRSYGSASSLSEALKKDDSGSHMNDLVHHYRKSKNSTDPRSLSPVSRHNKKSKIESPEGSGRTSPKMTRRNKEKYRSKSDVPDHKVLLSKLQKEKENQDMNKQGELTFEQGKRRRHHFAHYDWQSMLFSFQDVLVAMETLKRKNTPTGASKAAALAASTDSLPSKGSSNSGSQEDISVYLEEDEGLKDNKFNDLVASCPYFRNEIGGETDRMICVSASSDRSIQVCGISDSSPKEAQNVLTNHSYLSIVELENADQLLPPYSPPSGSVKFGIERVDRGAWYYRSHFFEKDHQNLFGIDEKYGPLVISLRREKVEDRGAGAAYQYRIIVRTCELCTLRGAILEEVISSTSRHPPNKGFPAKDVLEYICPEMNTSCLKMALATPKVHEQIMKVDEQNVHKAYKIGVLYCRAGQATEEDMYNNEHGSPAFEQFLSLLGRKVKLNGFEGFRGGLDVKTDSTGVESVFTNFNGYKIMFHVSTLLPFTPNNRQQLMRKRHIGNDITTIVFQEPGSEPFNPKFIRSHFQHVFVVVRAHNPCTENTCYSVAVTRSRNIPRFGPPIPEDSMFPNTSTFRDFLITKLVNGENTAHTAGKFKALAMNTREQYLRDLAVNNSTPNGLEGTPRFGRFSISAASRRIRENKEKSKVKPESNSHGALTWHVSVDDYSCSEIVPCLLGISDCVLLVVEKATRQLIFSIPCQAVLGWTVPPPCQEQLKTYQRELHIYYGRGERITIYTDEVNARDEIVLRLERFTKGSETVYRQLRRNTYGELGVHVNYEGVVMDVDPNSYAAVDGLKQSSRLVEICKVAVATMSHEEILDLLRTSDRVKVVVIPPSDDGTPRKCSMELYHLYPVLEVKKASLTSSLTTDVAHERSRSEPVQDTTSKSKPSRRKSEGPNHFLTVKCKPEEPTDQSGDFLASPIKLKVYKPLLSKTLSGNDTTATLSATATRLALVGATSGYRGQRKRQKSTVDNGSQSSATNTMSSTKSTSSNLSNYSGHDVAWTPGNTEGQMFQSSNSLSSDSGLNSNNNSSYSSTLSRCSSHTPTLSSQNTLTNSSRDQMTPSRNQNNNNLSALESQGYQARYKRLRNDSPSKTLDRNTLKTPQDSSRSFAVDYTPSSEIKKSLRVYIAGTEAYKRSKFNQSQSFNPPTSLHMQSRSEPVPTPIRWKNPTSTVVSHSTSEITNQPLIPPKLYVTGPRNKAKSTDVQQAGPRLRTPQRDRGNNPSLPVSVPHTPSSDVQSTLIRLLTDESPTKIAASKRSSPRKSPVRTASQVTSPKRRPSPSTLRSVIRLKPLHRTMSDESLCGARADDVIMARHGNSDLLNSSQEFYGHQASGSMDSLSPMHGKFDHTGEFPGRSPSPRHKPPSFPLPTTHDWDRLLDAAKAAEVLEASSIKSVSMGTLNDLTEVSPDLASAPMRNQRTMSVENLYDHQYRGDQGDPSNLMRPRDPPTPESGRFFAQPVTSQSLVLTKPVSDSEKRLEKIEREMKQLQDMLKQEQESKKALEEQVSSLRRDNSRLLRHVRSSDPDLVNGYKRTKRKSTKS